METPRKKKLFKISKKKNSHALKNCVTVSIIFFHKRIVTRFKFDHLGYTSNRIKVQTVIKINVLTIIIIHARKFFVKEKKVLTVG